MADPCGTFSITNVPTAQVGAVKAQFALDHPTSVTVSDPPVNGTVTVTAVFPACTDGSNPTITTPFQG
jgi:hypothetical protein